MFRIIIDNFCYGLFWLTSPDMILLQFCCRPVSVIMELSEKYKLLVPSCAAECCVLSQKNFHFPQSLVFLKTPDFLALHPQGGASEQHFKM